MTGDSIESKIDDRGRYSPAFAQMGVQREIQDINLTRRLASETESSAKFLNKAQMEGKGQISEMWGKVEPLLNTLLGAGQEVATYVLKIADKVLLLDHLDSVNNILQKLLGIEEKKNKEEPKGFLQDAVERAKWMQDDHLEKKRQKPLPPVR